MTNTTGSPPCCKASGPTLVEPQETIGCLSRPCYGSRALAAHGAICRPISDCGIVCTNAFPGGLERKYGMRYLPSLRATPTLRKSSLTVRLCVPTSMPPARRKKRRTGDRALAWRIEHQDSRSGGRLGYARPLSSDGRTGWRQSRSSALAGRAETRQSGCRQGLRYKRDHATSGFGGHRSEEHTSELQSLRHLVCRLLLEKKKKIDKKLSLFKKKKKKQKKTK